jgi:2-polyprenyl-3-methyl-5-hydroxy-6-metoxy-1,4-benzoquinol methylase
MPSLETGLSYETRLSSALKNFHQSLFDEKGEIRSVYREETDCPVCHESQSKELFAKDGFHYHRCSNCSLVYMKPRLNGEATKSFYNSDVNRIYNERKFDSVTKATGNDDLRNTENVDLLKDFQARHGNTGKKLLEVGCAKGVFLKAAQQAGYEVHGLELNTENCAYANSLIGGNVRAIDLFDMKYPDGSFDIFYMRDVIEHIHNPDAFLAEVSRILKPGGIVFLETHNIESWINRTVGPRHSVIFGFEHPVHWSPRTLAFALSRHGVTTKDVIFKSIDFTIRSIVRYYLQSSFTSVFPEKPVSGIKRFFLKALFYIFSRQPFRLLDDKVLPALADISGNGSTMKLISIKR